MNPTTSAPVTEVVVYPNRERDPSHELGSYEHVARGLADILGGHFGGVLRPGEAPARGAYMVPSATLVGDAELKRLGISSERDFFGGMVPRPWMATKVITHALVHPRAIQPEGWDQRFATEVEPVVLPGYSSFSLEDAEVAGRRMLREGPVRLKPATATAGRGQARVDDINGLLKALEAMDALSLARHGLVIETHLENVQTFSVGRVVVGDWCMAYCGTQCLTTDNAGEPVYGGSRLLAVRGGFDELMRVGLPAPMRMAVALAQVYDRAASECLGGLVASRRNYDVACGRDGADRERYGVLEQSWRIGGASGAEVAALRALHAEPQQRVVCAACHEVYGREAAIPPDAMCAYSGFDEEVGFISKYTVLESYGER